MSARSPLTVTAMGLLVALVAGGMNAWIGFKLGQPGLWALGLALWVGLLPAGSLFKRLQEGLDNRGLERERLTQRVAGWALRGVAMSAALVLWLDPPVQADEQAWVVLGGTLFVALGSWGQKRAYRDDHPSLAAEALRARLLVEAAALLLVGFALGERFVWGGRLGGLFMALRLFWGGQVWVKASTVTVTSCGGCGGGCGC